MELEILLTQISKYVKWNKARLSFLANFLIALIKVKTVNLTQVAIGFTGKNQILSNYRKIQRFLSSFTIDFSIIAKLIVQILGIKDSAWTIAIDRTNWDFGVVHINILMLCLIYKGSAFPLFWSVLPKKGNSNTCERCELISLFFSVFPNIKIASILADREFIGSDWFDYLLHSYPNISFHIRIRSNILIANSRGILVRAQNLFFHLRNQQSDFLPERRYLLGHFLFVAGLRYKDDLLIVVSNQNPNSSLQQYALRWKIESFFASCKTRGFCLEDSHLTHPIRIQKLLALISLAFAWAFIVGEFRHSSDPISIKKHGRNLFSFFRYGFDLLRNILLNFLFHLFSFTFLVSLLFHPDLIL